MKKIMLDAGHYGFYNQSPVFKSYYESEMAWKLQKYLKDALKEYGFKVGTTRSNQYKDLELYQRGLKAKGYDLFLSLHSNWCETEKTDRAVIIKSYTNKDNTLAESLANAIKDTMKLEQNSEITYKRKSNGDNWYGVIRGATDAGVKHCYILEHSFHSNRNATLWLSNEDNLKELARKEAEVIANYFGVRKVENFKNGSYNKVARVKCSSNLNVRGNRPNINGKLAPVIDTVANGKLVTLGYVYNNWGSIYYNNKMGFVNCDYLELVK